MDAGYKPPFDITENIANLVIEICQMVGDVQASSSFSRNPKLRKKNRIKTIYSSLSIEHNSLTEDQVSDVIDGKRVIAPRKDIVEVQNAYNAYNEMPSFNPFSVKDLLRAHGIMMRGLSSDAGSFRARGVGVYKGSELIHMGTRPEYVSVFIEQLTKWTKDSNLHPLIKACIFHYEFEYIHPFSDGNGRTGRLWHTLILSKWEPLFAWLPIESLVHERQEEYYKALADSDNEGKTTGFIEFMLTVVRDVLKQNVGTNKGDVGINVGINDTLKERVLEYLKENPKASARILALDLGVSSRQIERMIARLKAEGLLLRQGSNKSGTWVVSEKQPQG